MASRFGDALLHNAEPLARDFLGRLSPGYCSARQSASIFCRRALGEFLRLRPGEAQNLSELIRGATEILNPTSDACLIVYVGKLLRPL